MRIAQISESVAAVRERAAEKCVQHTTGAFHESRYTNSGIRSMWVQLKLLF
jgi:hypothetical protein